MTASTVAPPMEALEAELEPGQVPRVVVVNAVGAAVYRDDIAATIKYRKGMAVLERAWAALLERDIRVDVERRRLADLP